MNRIILSTACAAMALLSTQANAQVLGGGLGGGGSVFGSGNIGGAMENGGSGIGSTTGGSVSGTGAIESSRNVDTHSGHAKTHGSAEGGATGTVANNSSLPKRSVNSAAAGTTSGSASGDGDVQMIGTDAVRGAAGSAAGMGQGVAANVHHQTSGALHAMGSATGTLGLSGQHSRSTIYSGGLGQLALAGSAAASGSGTFDVSPGMNIVNAKGKVIGHVQSVATDAHGTIRTVVVGVGNKAATLPASNFSAEGNVLVSAMSKASIKDAASQPTVE